MQVIRKTLFDSATLRIGSVDTRPVSDACGDVEWQSTNVVVLPFSGVFVKYDAPGRHATVTPTHAVFIKADTPYRVSFPGALGDRALALRFSDALAPEQLERSEGWRRRILLIIKPANAICYATLWRRLQGEADDFEMRGSAGLPSLACVRRGTAARPESSWRAQRVKEAVALANRNGHHKAAHLESAAISSLPRVFSHRRHSLYDYVLHERLAHTLDAILDCGDDLTAVALDAGFSSHSHFTARFRSFFGCTPAALRRVASAGPIAEMHKIMTARRSALALS